MAADRDLETLGWTRRGIESFLAVAEERSIGRAADRLGRSAKMIRADLDHLDEEFGVALIERSHKGAGLTEEGKIFAIDARHLLDEMSRARTRVIAAGRAAPAAIRVGHLGPATNDLLIPALEALTAQNMGVGVELELAVSNDLISAVEEGKLDLAICRPVGRGIRPNVSHLFDDPLLLAVPRHHRLAQVEKVRIPELATLRFIRAIHREVPGLDLSETETSFYQDLGFSPQWTGDCADRPETKLALVAAGRGVAFVSASFAVQSLVRGIAFLPLDPVMTVPISVVVNSSNHRPSLVDYLVTYLRHEANRIDLGVRFGSWLGFDRR
jgi:DNA-binding transcriptional LysR family regulator